MKNICAIAAAGALFALQAAGQQKAGAYGGFQRPPQEALKALKAAVGKPFSSGWVFVEGRYLPPPYKVERWGNAIRINGVQVTGEIIPWSEFVKTQPGAVATRTETPAPAAAPEPEPEPEEEIDDSDASLDDLFDDSPSPKKKKPARKSAPRRRAAKPSVTVTYSFDGEFAHNEKTKSYLARINAERTRIDKTLRMGGYFFFGSGYSSVTGDSGAAAHLVPRLSAAMKGSSSRAAFGAACTEGGINYLPGALLDDLYRARVGYIQIDSRLREEDERKRWFGGAGGL